jgi:hypothetical protein
MIPIPPAPIPSGLLAMKPYLDVLLLLTVATLAVIFAWMLWSVWRSYRERARLRCPVRLRPVRVLFDLGPDGRRTDVLRCSVFGRRPITCGKACLHHAAPA